MNMKNRCLLKVCLFLSVIFVLASSCKKADIDLSDVSLDDIYLPGQLTFPLIGASEMTLLDLLEKGEIDAHLDVIEKNTIAVLLSLDTVMTYRQDDIDLEDAVILPLEPTLVRKSGLVGEDEKSFIISGIGTDIEINHVDINKMFVEMTVTTTNLSAADKNKLKIETIFPTEDIRTNENGTLSKSYELSNGDNTTLEFPDFSVGLAGNNKIALQTKVYTLDGQELESIEGASIKIEYNILTLDYETVWGKIPPKIKDPEKKRITFDIDILNGFTFLDPRLEVSAESNVGAKLGITIDEMTAYYSDNTPISAKFYDAAGNDFTKKSFVSAARAQEPGDIATLLDDYKLNKDSVNIVDLFTPDSDGKMPNELDYLYSIYGISDGNDNFMTRDAYLTFDVKAIIPLYVKISEKGIGYSNTLEVDASEVLPKGIAPDEIYLELEVKNGLPAEFSLEITGFYDENGDEVPEFYENGVLKDMLGANPKIIEAPEVNSDGTVNRDKENYLNPTLIPISIELDEYEGLRKLRSIAYEIRIGRSDVDDACFTIDDAISIKAGIYLKADMTISDFDELTEE